MAGLCTDRGRRNTADRYLDRGRRNTAGRYLDRGRRNTAGRCIDRGRRNMAGWCFGRKRNMAGQCSSLLSQLFHGHRFFVRYSSPLDTGSSLPASVVLLEARRAFLAARSNALWPALDPLP